MAAAAPAGPALVHFGPAPLASRGWGDPCSPSAHPHHPPCQILPGALSYHSTHRVTPALSARVRPPATTPPPLPLPLLLPPGRALRPAATTPAIGCLGNSKTEDQRNEEKAQLKANKKMEKQL